MADLLDDESLLEWAGLRESDRGDGVRDRLFAQPSVQQFVTWLREDDDDSDEDGDDESEEDDDDDA